MRSEILGCSADYALYIAGERPCMRTRGLEEEVNVEMENVYRVAAKLGYRATYVLRLVHEHGEVGAAKRLLGAPQAQSGLT